MAGRPRLALAVVSFLMLSLIACSSDDSSASPTQAPTRAAAQPTSAAATSPTTAAAAQATSAPAGGATNVTIADFSFTPGQLQARVGQPVRLNVTNGGQSPHTFTIQGVADSGRLNGGESKVVEFTPTQAGQLTFFCTIHGQGTMSGRITVAGASGALPPDAPSGGQPASGSTGGSGSGTNSSEAYGY